MKGVILQTTYKSEDDFLNVDDPFWIPETYNKNEYMINFNRINLFSKLQTIIICMYNLIKLLLIIVNKQKYSYEMNINIFFLVIIENGFCKSLLSINLHISF